MVASQWLSSYAEEKVRAYVTDVVWHIIYECNAFLVRRSWLVGSVCNYKVNCNCLNIQSLQWKLENIASSSSQHALPPRATGWLIDEY